jgi:hypothetical protein
MTLEILWRKGVIDKAALSVKGKIPSNVIFVVPPRLHCVLDNLSRTPWMIFHDPLPVRL